LPFHSPDRAEDFGLANKINLAACTRRAAMVLQFSLRMLAQKLVSERQARGFSPILHHQEPTAQSQIGNVRASRVMKTHDDGIVDTGSCKQTKYLRRRPGRQWHARTTKLAACLAHRGGQQCARRNDNKRRKKP
jgi:hypothetical protein